MIKLWIWCTALIGMVSCSNKDGVEGNIIPSNLVLTYEVLDTNDGTVFFTAKADNAASYDFDFGNGEHVNSQTGIVRYTYPAGGSFEVTVRAKTSSGSISVKEQVTVSKEQQLRWSDEFDGTGAPDSRFWSHDIGTGEWGWGNNESQYYTDRPDNVYMSDGTLKIRLLKEDYEGSAYTSARIKTQGKFSFTYGKVEIRAKLPEGRGTWPAGWMLGSNFATVGWPESGEIDILEHVGNQLHTIHGTLHFPGNYGGNAVTKTTTLPTATTDFHVYGMEWDAREIKFSIDGNVFHTFANSSSTPFHADFFLILNLAMGGNFGGAVDPAIEEAVYEIDYVRVYQ